MLKKIKKLLTGKTTKSPSAPEASAEIYRDIFEHSAIATAIIEEDGIFSRVNRKFEQLSGWSRAEIERKMSWRELADPDDLEKLIRYTGDVVTPGRQVPANISFCLRDKTGSQIPMALTIKRIPETRTVIASFVENSFQKKLEDMLHISDDRNRMLIEDLPLGMYRNDVETPGKVLWANRAMVRMYGYDSLDDLLKNSAVSAYTDPRDRERFIEELKKNGSISGFETLHQKKDGTRFPVRITARPKRNHDGEIAWIEGIIEDLTSERNAEELGSLKSRIATAAFDSATDAAIFATDPSGVIVLANRATEEMLGYSADELVGKQTPLLFHEESELADQSRALTENAGRPITGFEIFTHLPGASEFDQREWIWIKKDHAPINVSLTVAPIRTGSGNLLGYLFTGINITPGKQREDALRAANLQMSRVIDNLPDATFAIDGEGRVIAWNRAMEDLTGIGAVDILGKGNYEHALAFYRSRRPVLVDLINEPDEEIQDRGYLAIRRKGNSVIAESLVLDENNEVRILWSIAAPIFDDNGNLAGGIESLSDITERRKRETALKNTVTKFRGILDNTGTATAIIEEDDTISYINPEFGRTLGYVREEIEGKKKWEEFVVPEDARGLRRHWDKEGLLGDDPVRYEARLIRWDGEVRNAYITINRIPETQKIVVTILDITDKIKAESAVQRANQKLNFLNSVIRHDILNQLTVLKGNLEIAREENADPDQGAVLDKEINATEAIQSLITFTRDYQDIGISPPEWQDVRQSVLKSCEGILLGEITLSVEIEGVEIYADHLLSRVFTNLIQNAIRHGKTTTRIRIFCQESFEELHIVCEDDGVGVPLDVREKIFNRQFFSRTGLQLYLAREILSITSISICETGVCGTGACFELRVPKGGYRFIAAQQ